MIFITVKKIDNIKAEVMFKHFNPSELSEKDKLGGYLVEDTQKPLTIAGKIITEYYSYINNNIFYEYEDIPEINTIVNEKQSII